LSANDIEAVLDLLNKRKKKHGRYFMWKSRFSSRWDHNIYTLVNVNDLSNELVEQMNPTLALEVDIEHTETFFRSYT
jgi:hypothetical protein